MGPCSARPLLNVVSVGVFEDGLLDHHNVLSRQDYTAGQTRAHTGGSGTNKTTLSAHISSHIAHQTGNHQQIYPVHFICQVICQAISADS